MPRNHFLNTPEALLGRNDSKNPATTCKGLTSTGRPCRRGLALSSDAVNAAQSAKLAGVVVLGRTDARYYCWQHKDQAEAGVVNEPLTPGSKVPRTQAEVLKLKTRSSIDTLVQRLGIHTIKEEQQPTWSTRNSSNRPSGTPNTKPTTASTDRPHARPHRSSQRSSARGSQETGFWRSLCCMVNNDRDDTLEIVRRRKRVEQCRVNRTASMPVRREEQAVVGHQTTSAPAQYDSPLMLIPPETTAQIASNILGELSKPVSTHDEEGYIYIFWLTPSDRRAPDESTAKALLSPRSEIQSRARRVSDVLSEFSSSGDYGQTSEKSRETVLLKIGRATNVTRRMNEWQRQCGHQLNLVRWYPYVSSSSIGSSPKTAEPALYPDLSQYGRPSADRRASSDVRKVPNVKRVERLIHLELADQQAKQLCGVCGREHREWFKVEASEHGIRRVDAVVRRWVEWSEARS